MWHHGDKIAIGDTLEIALINLLSQEAGRIEVEDPSSQESLIEAIIRANSNLKESSNSNNWEMIGKDLQRLQGLINQLEILQEQEKGKAQPNTNEIDNVNVLDETIIM